MRNTKEKYVVGIDIGGTKCAVILGKGEIKAEHDPGFILVRECFKTKTERGWQYTIDKIINTIDKILAEKNISTVAVAGIGISCGGPLDYQRGIILSPPNLIGWNEVPIVQMLKERYQVPVYLQNDANACALAEWKFGAAKGTDNVVFLTFGTGLGAGLILNGRLYHGISDMAGEIGHVRLSANGPVGYGKAGSMEGFCSGGGIAQLAKIKLYEKMQSGEIPPLLDYVEGIEHITAKKIGEAAKAGDPLAIEILQTSGRYLGMGAAILIDLLNPEIIVIGSIYQRCEEFMRPAMELIIEEEALMRARSVCRVVPAGLKHEIGDYAALSVAFGH